MTSLWHKSDHWCDISKLTLIFWLVRPLTWRKRIIPMKIAVFTCVRACAVCALRKAVRCAPPIVGVLGFLWLMLKYSQWKRVWVWIRPITVDTLLAGADKAGLLMKLLANQRAPFTYTRKRMLPPRFWCCYMRRVAMLQVFFRIWHLNWNYKRMAATVVTPVPHTDIDTDHCGSEEESRETEASEARNQQQTGPSAAASHSRLSRLPLARIKALMKTDPDVSLASQESVFIIAKATVERLLTT